METLGTIITFIGMAFMLFGIVGISKFQNFYLRILVSSKIDTVGLLTLIIGLIIRHGLSFFSAKLLLLMAIILILNPLVAHMIARAAYLSGYKLDESQVEDNI